MIWVIISSIIIVLWYALFVWYIYHKALITFFQWDLYFVIIFSILFLLWYFLSLKAIINNKKKDIIIIFLMVTSIALILNLFMLILFYNHPFYNGYLFYLGVGINEEYVKISLVLTFLLIKSIKEKSFVDITFWKIIFYYIISSIMFGTIETFFRWFELQWFIRIIFHIFFLSFPFFIFQAYYKVNNYIDLFNLKVINHKILFIIIFLWAIFLHSIFDMTLDTHKFIHLLIAIFAFVIGWFLFKYYLTYNSNSLIEQED